MSAQDVLPATHRAHGLDRLPATVPAAAGLLAISAIVLLEHTRRLFDGITMAEETLGLAAIASLRHEVPAAVIEVFVGCGLLIAAYAIVRRSRLALIFAALVQCVIAVDALLRMMRGLAVAPAVALLLLAALTGGTVLASSTRAWCDEPVRLQNNHKIRPMGTDTEE
jgi:hypothetical protein